jgi:hypothetical protein
LSHTARLRRSATLRYPHHPLFQAGPTELEIIEVRSDMLVVRLPDDRRRGIPAWMFDEQICGAVRNSPHPVVDVASLLEITKILELTGRKIRIARDDCATQSNHTRGSKTAAGTTNPSIRKSESRRTDPERQANRVPRLDPRVNPRGRGTATKPSRRVT